MRERAGVGDLVGLCGNASEEALESSFHFVTLIEPGIEESVNSRV
jgi:hypothetical protein